MPVRPPLALAARVLPLAFLVLTACSAGTPASLPRHVPADADLAVLVPSLDSFLPALLLVADGFEGSEEAFAWLERPSGIDLRHPEALAETGLDERAGLAAFVTGGALCVLGGVDDQARVQDYIRERLAYAGFAPDAEPGLARRGERQARYAVGSRVAALCLASPIGGESAGPAPTALLGDAEDGGIAALAALTRAAGAEEPATLRVFARPDRTVLRPELLDAWLADAGLAAMFLKSIFGGFEGLGVRIRFSERGLTGAARLTRSEASGELPSQWLASLETGTSFAARLPSSTALLLQLRFNVETLRNLPPFLRTPLARAPGLAALHPYLRGLQPLADLLPHWDGRLGLAVLGLARGGSLAKLSRVLVEPRRLGEALSVAVLLGVSDPGGFEDAVQRRVAENSLAGRAPLHTEVELEGTAAWRLRGGRFGDLHALRQGDCAFLLLGAGDLERLARVFAGAAPSLVDRARGALDREVVGGSGVANLHVSFDRIARQLQCQGFPPYFLKVITSPDATAARLRIEPHAVVLDLEVSQ